MDIIEMFAHLGSKRDTALNLRHHHPGLVQMAIGMFTRKLLYEPSITVLAEGGGDSFVETEDVVDTRARQTLVLAGEV